VPPDAEHALTYDDLLQIVELVKASEQFSEFRLKVGEIEVELRRRSSGEVPRPPIPTPAAASSPQGGDVTPTSAASAAEASTPVASSIGHDDTRVASEAFDASKLAPGAIVIRAPMVGTFYRAPSPGAQPFVTEGQPVEPDTTVCIIEVMKLMNSIHAGERGRVRQILVADGASVQAGAPLIVLDRA
jgi:acetyl-CoA carboxylase biotin carboxyl carrier protein